MQGVIIGTIRKSGSGQHGYWALVEEPPITTKSGKTWSPTFMVNTDSQPPIDGTPVMAVGTVMPKLDEYNGEQRAKVSLSFGRITALGDSGASAPAPYSVETFADDCPF